MPRREFLDWKQPAIQSASEYLFDRYLVGGIVDLTKVTVVLPTRRAGRRLREVLLEQAAARQLGFFPPQITTVGSVPELLYKQRRPFASPLVQQLAWAHALLKVRRSTITKFLPRAPETRDDPRWLELASLLQRQHRELAGHQLDFAGVARRGKSLTGFADATRWQALAKVQEKYLETLDGLGLWDRQTARNFAVEHRECACDGDLILLGVVDLSQTLRAMLTQLTNVVALVYAPAALSECFDELGGVDPEMWQADRLPVEDRHLLIADGPSNQADAVVHAIDRFEGKYAPGELAIGVPDPSLVPHLLNKLGQVRLKARWGPGRRLAASRPIQWLRIVADFLADNRFAALAELMRHRDTEAYLFDLQYPRDAITELDRYFDEHLPNQAWEGNSNSPTSRAPQRDGPGDVPESVTMIRGLLRPLAGKPRHPSEWTEPLTELLLTVFGNRRLDPNEEQDRATILACDQLHAALDRVRHLPRELTSKTDAAPVILMLLGQLDEEEVPPHSEPGAIEMLGWLDLPLDDAKAVIVTNMNDGIVPQAVTSDLFLPNRLRKELGLDDNARRYARDAYALRSLLESRMAVRLVVGRRAATGDPLRPSRLLLAVHREELSARCLHLFRGATNAPPINLPVDRDVSAFEVPPPRPLAEPIKSLSVSEFNSYLDCPYRFYLQKVMRLKQVDDQADELDASKFGTLAHDVLEAFANSEFRDSSDSEQIRLYLIDCLRQRVWKSFGRHPRPTVQVQASQLRLRLEAFATRQSAWRQAGWQIAFAEHALPAGGVPFMVDGQPMQLRGRIDRIDYHPELNRYAVLDYKTGEAGDSPEKKHLKRRRKNERLTPGHWLNLQLPLYRHLVAEMGLQGELALGYILLPSDPSKTRFELAEWTGEELSIADEAARIVVRNIRREIFWPPTDPAPYPNDPFGAICQERIFGRHVRPEVVDA